MCVYPQVLLKVLWVVSWYMFSFVFKKAWSSQYILNMSLDVLCHFGKVLILTFSILPFLYSFSAFLDNFSLDIFYQVSSNSSILFQAVSNLQ